MTTFTPNTIVISGNPAAAVSSTGDFTLIPNDSSVATMTANTTAIQAAIDFAYTNKFQKISLPPGLFYCNPGIYLDAIANLRSSINNPSIFNFSLHLAGVGGIGNHEGHGTQLHFLDNTTNALIVGSGQGMRVSDLAILGPAPTSRAALSPNGIGVALAGGSGGLSRALIENVWVENFRAGFETGFNQDGLCDSVTFNKCKANACYAGLHVNGTQNYVVNLYACDFSDNTVQILSDKGKTVNVYGGNFSSTNSHSNAFTIGSVSGLTTVTDSTQLNGSSFSNRTFTATISSPDQAMKDGAYDAFVISTTQFGPIPLILLSFNGNTNVATFTFQAGWVIGSYGAGFDDSSGPPATLLQTALGAATTLYACETVTLFRGISCNVDGIHIENPGVLTTLFDQVTVTNSDRACRFNKLFFNYNIDQAQAHGGTPAQEAVFQCQAVHPFIRLFNGAATYIEVSNIQNASSSNPVIIDAREQDDRLIIRNCPGFLPNIRIAQVNAFGDQHYGLKSIPTGFGEWDSSPFIGSGDTLKFYQSDKMSGAAFRGFFPAQQSQLSISPEILSTVDGSLGAIGTYPPIMGGMPYRVGVSSAQGFPVGPGVTAARWVESNHGAWSYGQSLSINWNYYGATNVVNMSDTSRMFAGLKITLNDGTDHAYIVTGVYPTLGYVTVWASNGSTTVLDGTEGTKYTGSTVKQEAFSFSSTGLLPAAKFTTNTTSGATTAAIGDITGANFVTLKLTAVGAAAYTVRTAAQMFGDIPGAYAGLSYMLAIQNTAAGTTTLTADAGATVTINGLAAIAQNTQHLFYVTFPTSTTCTINALGAFPLTQNLNVTTNDGILAFGSAGATITLQGTDTYVGRATTDALSNKTITLSAGTASVAPAVFTSGTNLTAAAAGAAEFDGKVFYATSVASSRQVVDTEQFTTVQGSAVSLLNNSTNPQDIFASGGQVITLAAATTYYFEGFFDFSTGGTTHTTALGLVASSAFTNILYMAELWSVTNQSISTTAPSVTDVNASTATVLNATSTATGTLIRIKGVVRTNLASTLTPQVTFSSGPTGTCQTNINSWFRIWPVGVNTVQAVGNWA